MKTSLHLTQRFALRRIRALGYANPLRGFANREDVIRHEKKRIGVIIMHFESRFGLVGRPGRHGTRRRNDTTEEYHGPQAVVCR